MLFVLFCGGSCAPHVFYACCCCALPVDALCSVLCTIGGDNEGKDDEDCFGGGGGCCAALSRRWGRVRRAVVSDGRAYGALGDEAAAPTTSEGPMRRHSLASAGRVALAAASPPLATGVRPRASTPTAVVVPTLPLPPRPMGGAPGYTTSPGAITSPISSAYSDYTPSSASYADGGSVRARARCAADERLDGYGYGGYDGGGGGDDAGGRGHDDHDGYEDEYDEYDEATDDDRLLLESYRSDLASSRRGAHYGASPGEGAEAVEDLLYSRSAEAAAAAAESSATSQLATANLHRALEALASPTRALTAYADAIAKLDADSACNTFLMQGGTLTSSVAGVDAILSAREALHAEASRVVSAEVFAEAAAAGSSGEGGEGGGKPIVSIGDGKRIVSISVSAWSGGGLSQPEWAELHEKLSQEDASPEKGSSPPATAAEQPAKDRTPNSSSWSSLRQAAALTATGGSPMSDQGDEGGEGDESGEGDEGGEGDGGDEDDEVDKDDKSSRDKDGEKGASSARLGRVARLFSAASALRGSQSARRASESVRKPYQTAWEKEEAVRQAKKPKGPVVVVGAPSCMGSWNRKQREEREKKEAEAKALAIATSPKPLPKPHPLPPYAGAIPRAPPPLSGRRSPPLLPSDQAKLRPARLAPLVCFTNTRIAAAAPRAARLEPHQQLPQRLQFFLRTRITNRVGYDVKGFSFPEYTDDKYLLTATVQPGYESAGPTFLLDEKIVRHHVIGCTTWPSAEPYLKGELHLEIVVPSTDKVNPSVFPTTMIINAGNQTHRGDSHNEKPVTLQHTMGSNAVTGNELPRINVPCTPKPQRPPPKVRAVFDELSRPATASGATASGASAVVASDTDAPAGAPPAASPSSTSSEMRVLDIARLPLALRALGADLDSWAGKAALQVAHGWAKLGGDATLDLFEFSQAARELEMTKPPILKRDSPRRTSEGGRSWRHGSPYQTGVRERTKLVETIEGKVEGTDAGDRKRLNVALVKQPLQRAPAPRSPEEKEKQQLLQLQLQQSRQQQQHPLVPKLGNKLKGGAAEGRDDVMTGAAEGRDDGRRLEQAGLFVVELEGADGLEAVDMTNTSDPYVVLKLPGQEEWRSSVVPWKLNP